MRIVSFGLYIDLPLGGGLQLRAPPTTPTVVTPEVTSSPTPSLSCNLKQTIPTHGPSRTDLYNDLTNYKQVETVCAAHFSGSSGNATHETFNHGSILIVLERSSDTKPLDYCTVGINQILGICIRDGNTYGGTFSEDGETYTISNSIYPNNPLNPDDLGSNKDPGI